MTKATTSSHLPPRPAPLSRRSLFRHAVALGSTSAFLPLAQAQSAPAAAAGARKAPAQPFRLKIGLASYTLRKLSVPELVAACKDLGVSYLTAKEMHLPRDPEKLAAAVAAFGEAGITLTGGGVIYMKNDPVAVRRDFEYAREAGLPLIVAAPDPDALDLVESLVREFKIPVAIHNHGPEDKHYPGPSDVMKHIAKRDKRIGLCMDIGHTVRAGEDPIVVTRKYFDRLFDLHIKDLRDKNDKGSQTEVGRGVIDVAGLMKLLWQKRFQGHVALEYEINAENPVPGMRESLAYMRGIAAALAV